MDPEANLFEARELSKKIIKDYEGDDGVDPDDAARLADLVSSMDVWLSNGGFLPEDWRKR